MFSAQGGSCRESGSAWFGAWNCYGGGGGGGYIYVSTFADSGTLKARIDKIHLAPVFASPDLIYNPNSAYFFDSSIAQNAFIATGGDSESGADGGLGIVNIITTVEKSYRIAKILEPVDRPSLTARAEFNPYGLLLGDTIRVKINVSNLIPDTKVEDEILRANIGGREVECKNPRDFSPAGGAFDGVNKIYWNYIGTATSADFTYLCTIN